MRVLYILLYQGGIIRLIIYFDINLTLSNLIYFYINIFFDINLIYPIYNDFVNIKSSEKKICCLIQRIWNLSNIAIRTQPITLTTG